MGGGTYLVVVVVSTLVVVTSRVVVGAVVVGAVVVGAVLSAVVAVGAMVVVVLVVVVATVCCTGSVEWASNRVLGAFKTPFGGCFTESPAWSLAPECPAIASNTLAAIHSHRGTPSRRRRLDVDGIHHHHDRYQERNCGELSLIRRTGTSRSIRRYGDPAAV